MDKYEDIINLPHHVSKKHPQMSLYERSAQFAPYAALTGHGDAIKETGRLTSKRVDLDEEEKEILDRKFEIIREKINENIQVKITYFIPDLRKEGGKYEEVTGVIKKIDDYNHLIIMEKCEIPINEIVDIDGEILNLE
ncbi:MAG: YolD-like family protein [Clostridia bacterium]|nr:YolD-like family protein [Clostridia bacterium]